MSDIFISYRRDDTAHGAGQLYQTIADCLPSARIFMDVDNVAPGTDFVDVLEGSLSSCQVLLALIGRSWLDAKDERGKRRLDSAPTSFD